MSAMRIVSLLFRRVGDSLLATPAIRAAKQHFPDAEMALVCEPHVVRVFLHNPSVDRIVIVEHSPSFITLAAAIRRHGRPEVALDFLSDPRSALACLVSGAKRRIGFERRGRTWAYTDPIPRQDPRAPVYSALHKLELVKPLGVQATDTRTDFFLTDDDRDFATAAWEEREWTDETPVTAFFVHSRRDHKRWPLDCFREVIQKLRATNSTTPLVLVTPGDENAVAELRARADLSSRNVLAVRDLGQLGGVLERCNLLIGNDGGPKHIAVALNVPTVTVFGPDSPVHWTPDGSDIHLAVGGDTMGSRTAITQVLPSMVFDAAMNVLTRHD